MPIFGWIRDALGLHKDIIDSKKSKLEVDKLEDEKREKELLTRATLEDVKRYDPKYQALARKLQRDSEDDLIQDMGPPIKQDFNKWLKRRTDIEEKAGCIREFIYVIQWPLIIMFFLILFVIVKALFS